jgi:hypothetical protein
MDVPMIYELEKSEDVVAAAAVEIAESLRDYPWTDVEPCWARGVSVGSTGSIPNVLIWVKTGRDYNPIGNSPRLTSIVVHYKERGIMIYGTYNHAAYTVLRVIWEEHDK